jgi:hypothetical protein
MRTASFFDYDPTIGAYRFIQLTEENPTVEAYHGAPDEEGYHAEWIQWTLEDGLVVCTSDSDGRDCDGRHSSHSVYSCPVAELADRQTHEPNTDFDADPVPLPFKVPNWTEGKRSQRDYTAEAAGY